MTEVLAVTLGRAQRLEAQRQALLQKLVEEELVLDEGQREQLTRLSARVVAQLRGLAVEERMVVRGDGAEAAGGGGLLPRRLVEGYDALCVKVYGGSLGGRGDAGGGDDAGRRVVVKQGGALRRVDSSAPLGRVGGRGKGGKKPGASTRRVIGDEEAYRLKRAVDEQLRRVGSRMWDYLNNGVVGEAGGGSQCPKCGRLSGRVEERYCSLDGSLLVRLEGEG